MILGQNDTILLDQFSDIQKMPSLDSLVLDTDYEVLDNSLQDATIVSSRELSLSSSFSVASGDEVILEIDGFFFKNVVDNINSDQDNLMLVNNIKDKNNTILKTGSIKIKRSSNYIVKLIDLEEGNYIIRPTNQKIVVRASWVQPNVSLAEISAKLVDASNLKQSRLDSVKNLALKMIYSDISGFSNYYDIIDEIDLWALLFVKMECILSIDYEFKQEWYKPCISYENKINLYMPKEKFEEDSDGKSTSTIDNNISVGRYSL